MRRSVVAAVSVVAALRALAPLDAAEVPPPDSASLDQLVVSATRAPGGLDPLLIGSSITILGAQQLIDRQARTLTDVLRDVPGVSVSRAGPPGSVAQVRLRGTEANHALVLVDGMEATDPFFGEFDFATLHIDELARVEVLRGPQGALFGSDAIGGVIHYLTLSGREAPGIRLRAESGSFGTLDTALRVAGASGGFDYAVSAGLQRADGTPTARFGSRDIGVDNRTLSMRAGYDAGGGLRLRAVARASRNAADFNQQDFDFTSASYGYVIDSDDTSRNRSVQALLALDYASPEGGWQQSLQLQGLEARRDSAAGGFATGESFGRRTKGSYVASRRFAGAAFTQSLTFAGDIEREAFQNRGSFVTPAQGLARHIDNVGLVAQYDAAFGERAGAGVALRRDVNDRFDDAMTWRLQGSYRVAGSTRLRAAFGSGIKNPNPTELFGFDPDRFIGNADLRPERTRGWEVGVEQDFADGRVHAGVAYADARLDDEIFTRFLPGFVASPDNRDTRSRQRAVEMYSRAELGRGLRADVAWTFLDAQEDGAEEVRRPPQAGSLALAWQSADAARGLNITWRYNGRTDDFNFTNEGPPRVRLGSYQLLQVGARLRMTRTVEVFGRIENLLGETYEDVYTYRTPGRGFFLGLRATP
jgi:vitamin B12 transporter